MPVTVVRSQINTERMMSIGQNALYFEDYVLSIQYFNQVIRSKPYMAEPYFLRGVAKLYLEDYAGAEDDCSKALERNEFIVKAYVCRSFARMKLGNHEGAIADCDRGLEFDPENKALLYHKGFSLLAAKKYDQAEQCMNELIRRFPTETDAYMAKGQMNVERGDTLAALEDFSRTIAVDKYFAPAWAARGWVFLSRDRFSNAVADLNEAIRLKQDDPSYYMNRAMARYNLNDLRGTMDDFDRSIGLDPNSKLSYLNRAILRTTVGDFNRALEDYDKAIYLDPTDYQTIYNRGLVRRQLGKYREAAADFTTIIDRYPRFVPAYRQRSDLRKLMGDAKGADRDYFAAWNIEEKARADKASGKHPKKATATADTLEETNLRTYKRMIAAAPAEEGREQYQNPMRGRVQNQTVEFATEPLFGLSYPENTSVVGPQRRVMDMESYLSALNGISKGSKVSISNDDKSLTTEAATQRFASIDEYSKRIAAYPSNADLYLLRGLDFALVQDLSNALADLDQSIALNANAPLYYFERACVRYRKMNVDNATTANEALTSAVPTTPKSVAPKNGKSVETTATVGDKTLLTDLGWVYRDLDKVIELDPKFIYAYYNRGTIRCIQRDYRNALIDFTKALEINPDFAEAWYNRGVTQISLGDREHGLADLRMAGQLGIFKAYNLLKRFGE
jgi:tetratricopeptide (TPR) repeat protein